MTKRQKNFEEHKNLDEEIGKIVDPQLAEHLQQHVKIHQDHLSDEENLVIDAEHNIQHEKMHQASLEQAKIDLEKLHKSNSEEKLSESADGLANKVTITQTVISEDGTKSEKHFEATIEGVNEDGTLITNKATEVDPLSEPSVQEAIIDQPDSLMASAIKAQKDLKPETGEDKYNVERNLDLGGGLNIITGHQIAAEGDLNIPLSKMEEFETFDETFISEQLKIRYYNHRRVDVTKTQFMSIDNLLPKSKALGGGMNLQDDEFSGTNSDKNFEIEEEIVEEGHENCVSPWILNGEVQLTKCIKTLRKDARPWCSLDEIFQGNFEFCPETLEEIISRENVIKSDLLVSEAMSLVGGWDSRRSLIKQGYEKLDESYQLGNLNTTGFLAWAKLGGFFLPLNIKDAKSMAEDGAARGRPMDQAVLGFMHSIGVGFPADQGKALIYLSFAAAGGSQPAQMALGYRYRKGYGVKANCETSLRFYQDVALRVVTNLSFSGGTGKAKLPLEFLREQTLDEAGLHDMNILNYYELLVTQGDLNAMFQLGNLLVERGYEPDLRRAADLFRKASDELPAAAARLGRLYMDGRGYPKDNKLAFDWLKKAADKQNPMGLTYLGVMYELGMYGEGLYGANFVGGKAAQPKYQDAFKYYKQAADLGYPEAQYRIGVCYLHGYGTKQDIRASVKNLQLASQHQNLRAIMQLAEMQSSGRGIPRSCDGAVDMYKNVAERGLYARLFMMAGHQYKQEKYQSAYILYSLLGEMGFSIAQQNVAQLLEENDITITGEENIYPRALLNYNRAAEQGLSSSRLKVGDYTYYGHGTQANLLRASEHYRIAAEEGANPQAFFNLGFMHQYGEGLSKDKFLAKRYYDQSIEVNPNEAMIPATIAILYLNAEDYLGHLSLLFTGVTAEDVNLKLENIVLTYLGANWDIYFILFLFCILMFVISFRRQ